MARQPDMDRRRALLAAAVPYLVEHGVAQVSLRPLAAALGTSDRMLIHHFGSKEELIRQALRLGLPDLGAVIEPGDSPPVVVARNLWQRMTTGDQRDRVRLLLEVMTLSLTQPDLYRSSAAGAVTEWIDAVRSVLSARGIGSVEAEIAATILTSGLKGLALDVAVTGEHDRVDRAAQRLIDQTVAAAGIRPDEPAR